MYFSYGHLKNTIVFVGSIGDEFVGGKETASHIKNIRDKLDFQFDHQKKKIRVTRFSNFGDGLEYDVKEVKVPKYTCRISEPQGKFKVVDENLPVEYCLPQKRSEEKSTSTNQKKKKSEAMANSENFMDDLDEDGLFHCTENFCIKTFTQKNRLKKHLSKIPRQCVWPIKTSSTEEKVKDYYFDCNSLASCSATHQTISGKLQVNIKPLKKNKVPSNIPLRSLDQLTKVYGYGQGYAILDIERTRFSPKVIEWLREIYLKGEYSTKNPTCHVALSKMMKRAFNTFEEHEILEAGQIKGVLTRFDNDQRKAGLEKQSEEFAKRKRTGPNTKKAARKPRVEEITEDEIDELLEEDAMLEGHRIVTKIREEMTEDAEKQEVVYIHPVQVSHFSKVYFYFNLFTVHVAHLF